MTSANVYYRRTDAFEELPEVSRVIGSDRDFVKFYCVGVTPEHIDIYAPSIVFKCSVGEYMREVFVPADMKVSHKLVTINDGCFEVRKVKLGRRWDLDVLESWVELHALGLDMSTPFPGASEYIIKFPQLKTMFKEHTYDC
jgi:hypothetical protein